MYGPSVGVAAIPLSTAALSVLAEGLTGDQGGGPHRYGKKDGEKFSPDNNLRRSMPALPRRCPDRRRCVADVVRDGCWSR